jgi:hypothetical protein
MVSRLYKSYKDSAESLSPRQGEQKSFGEVNTGITREEKQ